MLEFFSRLSLVTKIIIAIILGIGVALLFPTVTPYLSLFGELFIKALKIGCSYFSLCTGSLIYCQLPSRS